MADRVRDEQPADEPGERLAVLRRQVASIASTSAAMLRSVGGVADVIQQ